jgi:uncharacterized protein YvpB
MGLTTKEIEYFLKERGIFLKDITGKDLTDRITIINGEEIINLDKDKYELLDTKYIEQYLAVHTS